MNDNVWLTDVGRHTVLKFSPDGHLLLTLGTPDVSGLSETLFNQLTDVLVVPTGEVFVADGYGNSRIVKFSADGHFVSAWGCRGTRASEFHTPHALAHDSRGRLYVSDRENGRIQIFDFSGRFIAIWEAFDCVNGILVSAGSDLYLVGGETSYMIQRLNPSGEVLQQWPNDPIDGNPHWIWQDADNRIYVSNVDGACVSLYLMTTT